MEILPLLTALGAASMSTSGCTTNRSVRFTSPTVVTTSGNDTVDTSIVSGTTSAAEIDPVVVHDGYRYLLRLEMASLRDTALEDDARRLFRAIPAWRSVIAETGLDPTREFDAVLVASPERASRRYLVMVRHNSPLARAEQIVASYAASRGDAPPEWREGPNGTRQTTWPGEPDVDQALLLIPNGWLVLGPREEVNRIAMIRSTPTPEILSGLAWTEDVQLTDADYDLQASGRTDREPARFRPNHFMLTAHAGERDAIRLRWTGEYASADLADAARQHWEGRRDEYAGNVFLRLVGLAAPVEAGEFQRSGAELTFNMTLTPAQLGRLIRFATPMLVGNGRAEEPDRTVR